MVAKVGSAPANNVCTRLWPIILISCMDVISFLIDIYRWVKTIDIIPILYRPIHYNRLGRKSKIVLDNSDSKIADLFLTSYTLAYLLVVLIHNILILRVVLYKIYRKLPIESPDMVVVSSLLLFDCY